MEINWYVHIKATPLPLFAVTPRYFSLSNLTWIQINKLGNLQRTPSNSCSCLIASHKIVAKKNKQDNHCSCSLDWTGPEWIALIGLTWFIRSYKKCWSWSWTVNISHLNNILCCFLLSTSLCYISLDDNLVGLTAPSYLLPLQTDGCLNLNNIHAWLNENRPRP